MIVADPEGAEAQLRPSEYTSALLQVLRCEGDWVRGARVLDVGVGSGVFLAAMAALGAVSLTGVDIERQAVAATQRLCRRLAFDGPVEIHEGYLFNPVEGRRFDLITANLPHFPMDHGSIVGRLPTWNSGGADGRRLLDPFVADLGRHLTPRGRALIAHNAFVDLDATRAAARHQSLHVSVVMKVLAYIAPAKLACMTVPVLAQEVGRTIHRYGDHTFGEVHVLAIRHDTSKDGEC